MKKFIFSMLVAALLLTGCGDEKEEGGEKESAKISLSEGEEKENKDPEREKADGEDTVMALNASLNPYITGDEEFTYLINYNSEKDIYEILKQENTQDGKITVLKTAPEVDLGEGASQEPFAGLMLVQDRLYYFANSADKLELAWISTDGKKEGKFPEDEIKKIAKRNQERNAALYGIVHEEDFPWENYTMRGLLNMSVLRDGSRIFCYPDALVDLEKETVSVIDFPGKENHGFNVIGLHQGRIYYFKSIIDEENPYGKFADGIYVMDLDSGEEKELCSMKYDSFDDGMFLFAGRSLYYSSEYASDDHRDTMMLHAVDLSDGKKRDICTYTECYGFDFGIFEDTVYYFRGANLYKCSSDGSGEELLAEDYETENYKTMMGIGCGYLYYWEYGFNDPWFRRMPLDGRIFPVEYVHAG